MMRTARLLWTALLVLLCLGAGTGHALGLQPPASPDEFVPISQLPPGEQLPAAPFLVGAYACFLVLMMYYLWTIWRRIGKVEADMHALERRSQGSSRKG